MLLSGRTPDCLKGSATKLISKTSEKAKLKDISQWRPISIGSAIIRAISGVLCRTLNDDCWPHQRQKDFIESPGCSENLMLLEGMIKMSKREKKTLAVNFIDFTKTFDRFMIRSVEVRLDVWRFMTVLTGTHYLPGWRKFPGRVGLGAVGIWPLPPVPITASGI